MTELLASQTIGTVIAQRFEIVSIAGRGGMGTVFRARDLRSGRVVALKLLLGDMQLSNHGQRFCREVAILAQLRHPNIVSYIEHGFTSAGQPFLIMEWLDGEDLALHLQKGPLTLAASLHILSQAADALSAAHALGFVHRDIKPSNLFLRQGKLDSIALLDFGLARPIERTHVLTKTGAILGTIDYMAPEQARGHHELGPAADVFSLGCVLFECLIGHPPFVSDSMAGVLAKILLDDVPPLRRILPAAPGEIEQLLRSMLDKDPARRPPDAASVLGALRALGPLPATTLLTPPPRPPPRQQITGGEQFVVSVVVAVPRTPTFDKETTLEPEQSLHASHQRQSLRDKLRRFGAIMEFLPDGTIVSTLTQNGVATDQAAQAARYALALQECRPEMEVSLATGRAQMHYSVPIGEAIDRALHQLPFAGEADSATSQTERSRDCEDGTGIYVDEVSAGLLDSRFTFARMQGRLVLQAERATVDDTRLLLGKPTPCVGREQELAMLETLLRSCIEDPRQRVALITAPPGFGKSRIRHEFLRRMRLQYPEVEFLFGVADPMSAGSPYAILGQMLRRLCGVFAGEPLAAQQSKLHHRIGRYLEPPDAPRIVAFIGEISSIAFSEEGNSLLSAARQDPKIMDQQVTQAFIHWLSAECRHQPLLLVLEDLHWADSLTIRLLDAALRELPEQPLMCLALARPEIERMFVGLWSERARYNLHLGGLSRNASERLIREVLGNQLDRQTVQRIIDQSAGNALYLEELMRAVAIGKGDTLPETVLAMMQSRLMRLPAGERRLLRAASILGGTFWYGGLRALLGHERSIVEVDSCLESLLASELIERHPVSRFPGDSELGFRHALLRDAAYGMLTENDRRIGHHLAGRYLQAAGEDDPIVLAEHAERSGDGERAIPFLAHAAEQCLDRNDLAGAIRRAERGIAAGAQGELLGTLLALQLQGRVFSGDMPDWYLGREAMHLLPKGSRWWCKATTVLFYLASHQEQPLQLGELVSDFAAAEPQADARSEYVTTASWVVIMFSFLGQRAQAAAFLEPLRAAVAPIKDYDIKARGLACTTEAWYERLLRPHPYSALVLAQEAVAAFAQVQDHRNLVLSQLVLASAWADLGDAPASQAILRESLHWMEQVGDAFMVINLKCYLAMQLARSGDPVEQAEADVLSQAVIALSPNTTFCGMSRMARAQVMLATGQLAAAEEQAMQAAALLGLMRPFALVAAAVLIEIKLRQQQLTAALTLTTQTLQIMSTLGIDGYYEIFVRVRCAEVYHAAGEVASARELLGDIMERLRRRAQDIPDALTRQQFLTRVAENARAAALARLWLTDAVDPASAKSTIR